uniref:Uncharacterized protein n=1 Tax=Anguilla anguilla TaxID=7936 RepID=A0A0E9WJX4_ANGAN
MWVLYIFVSLNRNYATLYIAPISGHHVLDKWLHKCFRFVFSCFLSAHIREYQYLVLIRIGCWSLSQRALVDRQEYTLDRSPHTIHSHTHTYASPFLTKLYLVL